MRKFNRKNNQIREITIKKNINLNADGSCLISQGNTKVICTATFEKDVPIWLKNKGSELGCYRIFSNVTGINFIKKARNQNKENKQEEH